MKNPFRKKETKYSKEVVILASRVVEAWSAYQKDILSSSSITDRLSAQERSEYPELVEELMMKTGRRATDFFNDGMDLVQFARSVCCRAI